LWDTLGFPLVRLVLIIHDLPNTPLVLECFLDLPGESTHRVILDALSTQGQVPVYWYDDDFRFVRSTTVPWDDSARDAVRDVAVIAEEMLRPCSVTFETALETFCAELALGEAAPAPLQCVTPKNRHRGSL